MDAILAEAGIRCGSEGLRTAADSVVPLYPPGLGMTRYESSRMRLEATNIRLEKAESDRRERAERREAPC